MTLGKNLLEEIFFFMYNLGRNAHETLNLPINTRKWLTARFVEQKEKENEAIEAQRRAAKRKH